MTRLWSQIKDLRLRRDAIKWLQLRTNGGEHSLTRDEINDFFFDGERFKLIDPMKGIRKPRARSRTDNHDVFQKTWRRTTVR